MFSPHGVYVLLAVALSIFYGVRAAWITREAPRLERWHQIWFNFAGSALGWLVGYWILRRFSLESPIGLTDILLMVFAALGIVGYLPCSASAGSGESVQPLR